MLCVTAGQTSVRLLDCVFTPQQIGPDKSLAAAEEASYTASELSTWFQAKVTLSAHQGKGSSRAFRLCSFITVGENELVVSPQCQRFVLPVTTS